MSENFNIEEQLQEHLLDATATTPPDLFAKIEAQIEGKERRKKRLFIWFWFGAGMAVFLTAILLISFEGNGIENGRKADNEIMIDTNDVALVKPTSQKNLTNKITQTENEIDTVAFRSINSTETLAINQTSQNSNNDNNASNLTYADLNNDISNTTIIADAVQTNNPDNTNRIDATDKITTNDNNTENDNNAVNSDDDITDDSIDLTAKPNVSKPTAERDSTYEISSVVFDASDSLQNDIGHTITEIDSTIVAFTPSNDSTDAILIATENHNDTTSIPAVDLVTIKDSIRSIDSTKTSTAEPKINTFGLLAYGGYMAFDQAVFKPYFSSGLLSQVSFPSVGSEFGLGAYYRFNNRFEFSLVGSYGQRQTSFNYDLMISENDFFNRYENDVDIPLENLDDPTSCNCFLAQDVSLDYSIQTIAFALNTSYDLIKKPTYSFGPLIGFGTVANTKFTNNSSTIIGFSPELKERFTSSTLRMGLNFHYQITPKMQLGLAPSFNLQFEKKSGIYAKNSQLFLVPIQLKFAF